MRSSSFRNEAFWAVALQFPVVILLSPFVGLVYGSQTTVSFVVGGLLCVLPNFYLYRRVFAHHGARAAKKIFKSLYWGEMVKVLLTGMGFTLAVITNWVIPIWLFVGYITAQLSFAITSLVLGVISFHYYQKTRTE